VGFLWASGLNAKDINKELSPVYSRKCFSRKVVHNWVEKFSQGHLKVAEVCKWLQQQSKDFYDAGFNVGGEYVEK
jgi:hypothetical protein